MFQIDNNQQTNAVQQNEEADELLGEDDPTQEVPPAPTASASTAEKNMPPPRKGKKRPIEDKRLDTAFKLLTSCASTSIDVSDECTDFGNFVAKKIRGYDLIKRSTTMHAIMGIFLNTDMAMENTHMRHQQISYNNSSPGGEQLNFSTYRDFYPPHATSDNSSTSANSERATPHSSEMHCSDLDDELCITQLI